MHGTNNTVNNEDLWKNTVSKYLEYDLWDEINCYDAGHVLLVPMYYAFTENDQKKWKIFMIYLKDMQII